MMDDRDALLRAHDEQVRGTIAQRMPAGWIPSPDGRVLRIRTPHGGIVFSDGLTGLDEGGIDALVARAQLHFADGTESVEWKTYSTDHPGLVPALVRHGFVAEPVETVLVGTAAALVDAGAAPPGVALRRVTDRRDLERIAALESEVWDDDWSWLADDLAGRLATSPDDLAIWVAEAGEELVSAAWLVRLPGTGFGGLWGGSTLAAWRGRGIYRALVAERARAAQALGIRHLWVDASDDSRPILQRLGLTAVATTTPYVWSPVGAAP